MIDYKRKNFHTNIKQLLDTKPELLTGRLVQARTRPEPENISPNLGRTRKLIWSPNYAQKTR